MPPGCSSALTPNGNRIHAWKVELARLAPDMGLDITVAHFPPGTSKWNKIEHRMFSFITRTGGVGPHLVSGNGRVDRHTTTTKGLQLNAELGHGRYPTGVKITDKQLAAVPLTREDFRGDWNYTVPNRLDNFARALTARYRTRLLVIPRDRRSIHL
jgi:hypothetical protein